MIFQSESIRRAYRKWIPAAVAVTVLSLVLYTAVQQSIRMNADDPQVQIAQDIASAITAGNDPRAFPVSNRINYAKSLSPFVMIFDKNKKLVVSSGQLEKDIPEPPKGVLDAAKTKSDNRVTWEPKKGIRNAIVVRYYKINKDSGYVLAGRSLKEVEDRENKLLAIVTIGWLGTLALTFIAYLLTLRAKEEKRKR